jgi:hypothetical protein
LASARASEITAFSCCDLRVRARVRARTIARARAFVCACDDAPRLLVRLVVHGRLDEPALVERADVEPQLPVLLAELLQLLLGLR